MAGDWIKMRTDLSTDPAVIATAARLNVDEDSIVGKLHRLWSWANHQTTDGNAVGVTSDWINRYLDCEGLAEALCEVGWMVVSDDSIQLPKFERHNGESAKKRAQTAKRVQKYRNEAVGKRNAPSVTDALPEKRREEKEKSTKSPPPPPRGARGVVSVTDVIFPDCLNTAAVRSSLDDWLEHKQAIGKPYKSAKSILLLLKRWTKTGPSAFVDAVEFSIAQGYQGLFGPTGGVSPPVANPSRLHTGQTYDDMEVIDVEDLP